MYRDLAAASEAVARSGGQNGLQRVLPVVRLLCRAYCRGLANQNKVWSYIKP